jgi:BlaI family penicillinase repressor
MARPVSSSVTDAEHAILEVLWEQGEATVRDVTDRLAEKRPVAYNTVLTMLGVLRKKELVTFREEGRAFVYRAAVSKDDVRSRALDQLLGQLFDGSPEALALHLLSNHDIDPAALQGLRDKVRAARKEGDQ